MVLIIGLGNPGERYAKTRHNLGFMVVDELARKLLPPEKNEWQKSSKFKAEVISYQSQVILVKPQTFMNASGFVVSKIAAFYKIKSKDVWVIHDDLDLIVGKIKVRRGGSSAGHRGVESIISQLGDNEFVRFRLGIGHPHEVEVTAESYVLSEFASKEFPVAKRMVKKAVKAIMLAMGEGLEKTMNAFN